MIYLDAKPGSGYTIRILLGFQKYLSKFFLKGGRVWGQEEVIFYQ